MMLLEKVQFAAPGSPGREYTMTHEAKNGGAGHVLRFYEPDPAAGPLAGKLVFTLTMDGKQALELKHHL